MKKILFFILVILIVFLIYIFNKSDKIYYFSIENYGYSKSIQADLNKKLSNYVIYNKKDYRLMDLINDINYNKKIMYNNKIYTFDNLLVKANFMTISIGMDDLTYKKEIDYNYLDELLIDIDKLLKIIRKYNKDKIYFTGLYKIENMNKYLNYVNKKIEKMCKNYNIIYIDISNLKEINKSNNLNISSKILNFTNK